jgi:hypothetical protein
MNSVTFNMLLTVSLLLSFVGINFSGGIAALAMANNSHGRTRDT